MIITYEPEYVISGWFNGDDTRHLPWFSRDLTNDTPITLNEFIAGFHDDPDVFFETPPITVVVFPGFFNDDDLIFGPISIRALVPGDQMLKNEVRRIR